MNWRQIPLGCVDQPRANRIGQRTFTIAQPVEEIRRPFADVAQYVEQTPRVLELAGDGVWLSVRVSAVPGNRQQVGIVLTFTQNGFG